MVGTTQTPLRTALGITMLRRCVKTLDASTRAVASICRPVRHISFVPAMALSRQVSAWQNSAHSKVLAANSNRLEKIVQGRRFLSSLPNHSPLTMPALSPTMTQGNIGDHLCDLETDKATIAWEAQDEGYVAAILAPEGASDVPVGQVVLVICENEADVPAFANYKASSSAPAKAAAAPPSQPAAAAAAKPAASAEAPKPPPAPQPSSAPPKASTAKANGKTLLDKARHKEWVFSNQFGLPTPHHNYG